MATGDIVCANWTVSEPTTLAASFSVRTGGSTPAETVPYYAFDPTTAWYMDFYGTAATRWSGSDCNLKFSWAATSATAGDVIWKASIRRQSTADDADVSFTYTTAPQSVTSTAPGTSGFPKYATIAFTAGANMNNLAAGEGLILRFWRDAAAGGDTMTGNAELRHYTLILEEQ